MEKHYTNYICCVELKEMEMDLFAEAEKFVGCKL
jgi:hypothetical protein